MQTARHDVAPLTTSLAEVTRAAGFRRIQLVRIVLDGRQAEAQATGVLHRYPRTVHISMTTACRLVAAGAPVRVERVEAGGAG